MRSVAAPLTKSLLFTVLTVAATVVLGITISNVGVGDTARYQARFTDVTSLNVGDDIRVAGVRVGQVEQIEIVDHRVAQVEFSLAASRRLPGSTTAAIKYRNLIGQRYIALDEGGGQGATLAPGSTIGLDRTTPALDLTDLFNGFQPLFHALNANDVNQLSSEIIQVLQGEGTTVDSFVAHTASLTSTLADKDQVIGHVVDNLNSVLKTITLRGDELGSLVTTAQQLVSGLAKDREPIGRAISALSSLTDSTAGLLEQGREPLKQDISALGQLSTNLAGSSDLVQSFLQNLPKKMDAIGRMASYGSWLNFYLCSATVTGVSTTNGAPPPTGIPLTQPRCQR
ncbi:MCE family protein [Kutzneria albida]|uniref:Uncharacterized protein n=1 Tax=Kutzneria albida DSM 43870 TaxID=1449976 RepID=W5WFZ0_9PSEU|nr:MCE family protein [Kutzneria albida]AHH99757.1 hypothetical protein KALB_6397 [Kutzneria albida DSM 43870]